MLLCCVVISISEKLFCFLSPFRSASLHVICFEKEKKTRATQRYALSTSEFPIREERVSLVEVSRGFDWFDMGQKARSALSSATRVKRTATSYGRKPTYTSSHSKKKKRSFEPTRVFSPTEAFVPPDHGPRSDPRLLASCMCCFRIRYW